MGNFKGGYENLLFPSGESHIAQIVQPQGIYSQCKRVAKTRLFQTVLIIGEPGGEPRLAIQTDQELDRIYRYKTKHTHINVARCLVAKRILILVYHVWSEDRNYLPVKPLSKNYSNKATLINL